MGFCQEKIPDHLRSQIKVFYEVRGYDVKIIESRPDFMRNHEWTETPIARLKYDPDTFVWQLYWMRASGKWEKYAELKPTNRLQLADRGNRERSVLRVLGIGGVRDEEIKIYRTQCRE